MSEVEALAKISFEFPGKMEIQDGYHVSDWQAAKKIYHAYEFGINPKDYGMTKEDLQIIRTKGLTKYVRMGRRLPPKELIQAYQCSLKVFCESATSNDSTYNSRAENLAYSSTSYTSSDSNIIVTFKKDSKDLITGGGYSDKAFANYKESKTLGRLRY